MPGEVLHDCVNQLGHPTKAAGQNRLLTQVSEKVLKHHRPLVRIQIKADDIPGARSFSSRQALMP